MKKKEDMRKLFKEEKTGLRTGTKVFKIFVVLLFVSHDFSAQVPINGFCKYTSFKIPSGYSGLIIPEDDSDNSTNLILYSTGKKELASIVLKEGEPTSKKIKINYGISSLIDLSKSRTAKNMMIFTSRQNRLLGMLERNADSTLKLNTILEFDSYPENISIADINNDGVMEYLISGSGFDGLSIVRRNKYRLAEKKIISEKSYSKAIFGDITNDDYPDVVAYNVLESSLQLFYNNSEGQFELARSIKIDKLNSNIQTADLDNDDYADLVYGNESEIHIMYGDFASAFKRNIKLKTRYATHLINYSDFNNDNQTDIVYLNKEFGTVSIFFGKGNGTFYDEIVYLKKSGIVNFNLARNGNKTELFCLDESGYVYVVSPIQTTDINSKINFIPSSDHALIFGSYDEKGNSSLGFIDSEESTMNLFTGQNNFPFIDFYKIPLAESYSQVKVENSQGNIKYFYFYSSGSKLIEIIIINTKNKSYKRNQLYSPGVITDLEVRPVNKELINVYITYNKLNKLYLGRFEQRELSITFTELPVIDISSDKVNLVVDSIPVIYYWKSLHDSSYYMKAEIKSGPNKYHNFYSTANSDVIDFNFLFNCSDDLNSAVIAVINTVENQLVIMSEKSKTYISSGENRHTNLQIEKNSLIAYKEIDISHGCFVTRTDNTSQQIYWIEINRNKKMHKLVTITLPDQSGSYFLTGTAADKKHLYYSNKNENCISLLNLK